jgi:predicted ferric reductase
LPQFVCRAALAVRHPGAAEIGSLPDDASCSRRRVPRPALTGKSNNQEVHSMLYTIAVVLVIMWLLGLVTSYTMGGFIHILLVVAVIMILVNLISGRRTL